MRDHGNLQNTMAELKLQFNSPITLELIIRTFKNHTKSSEEGLKDFILSLIKDVFEVIQIENISGKTSRIEGFVREVRDKGYIKFKMFENGNYEEANILLRDIYTKWNEIQLRKELCSDHIVLIKKAMMYLTSFKKVISAFIQESDIHKIKFKNLADSKRYTEVILVSVESYVEVLKSQINELSAWIDNTLSSRINMLMRADSSLRLLSKYAEWDYSNKCGNVNPREYGHSQADENFKY